MGGELTIRAASVGEMALFADWADAEGWNPGLFDGGCYRVADGGGFLIGAAGGEDVAIVSAVRYGEVGNDDAIDKIGNDGKVGNDGGFGFLGFYIVRADVRGRGFGLRMWRAAMERLAGCDAIGLDGVADQVDSYAKSGFSFAFLNTRRQLTGGGAPAGLDNGAMPAFDNGDKAAASATMPAGFDDDKAAGHLAIDATMPAGGGVVELSALPFDDVAGYLLPFFPAPRLAFYRAWMNQPGVVALGFLRAGKVAGVGVMRKCRIGRKIAPLFADDDGIADKLLRALAARADVGESLFMDMPDINPAAKSMAHRYQMQDSFTIARMYKGNPPPLPTAKIYAITSPEIG